MTAPAPKARARPAGGHSGEGGQVGLQQQKAFIISNADILNIETKSAILSVVVNEMASPQEASPDDPLSPGRQGPPFRDVVMELKGEVNINLDLVGNANPDVLRHIYNIVAARRQALSLPAGGAQRVPDKPPRDEAPGPRPSEGAALR